MIEQNFTPIYKIENGFIKSKVGSYGLCYKIEYKNIFTLSENDYIEINQLWKKVFNMLPDYSILHKMDIFVEEKYKPERQPGEDTDMFGEAYFKKFLEFPYTNNTAYLFFIKTSKKLLKRNSVTTLLTKKSLVPKDLIDTKIEKEFLRSVDGIVSLLTRSGYFKVVKVQNKELISTEKNIGLFERYHFLNFTKNRYVSDFQINSEGFSIGNKNVSIYAVNDLDLLPAEYSSTFEEKLYKTEHTSLKFSLLYPIGLGLARDHIVNQIFFKTNKDEVISKLEADNKGFSSFIGSKSNESNFEHNVSFMNECNNNMRDPIYCHLNVIVWYNDKSQVREIEGDILENFNKFGFTPKLSTVNSKNLFFSCFPGNAADFPFEDESFLLHDIQAAALSINEGTTKSNVSDFGLRLSDRLTGKPVYVDISDLPLKKGLIGNRNKIIFGPSGSGKSFGCNNLVNSYIRTGAHVVIVDVGDSYQRQCEYYGGYYFKYDEEKKPLSFNPFFVEGSNPTEEKLDSLVTLIFTLWKKNVEDYEKIEQTLLQDALIKYYAFLREDKDVMACFNTFYEFVTHSFFDIINKTPGLENKFDMLDFRTVLRPFYKGGNYDYLLNATKDMDLYNKNFMVFELDNIKDNKVLFPVVTLIIMETFINKMLNLEGVRKVIIIEEAWKAIANEGMATFIKYLYKTCRKHFGETILVTQEPDDLIGNKIVKNTVISQSPCKILMDMKEYVNDFDEIQKVLGLPDKAKDLILSINKNLRTNTGHYKEQFIALGDEYNVYGVDVSKEEYALYTTEKLEKEKIEYYKKKYGSLELGIKNFVNDM